MPELQAWSCTVFWTRRCVLSVVYKWVSQKQLVWKTWQNCTDGGGAISVTCSRRSLINRRRDCLVHRRLSAEKNNGRAREGGNASLALRARHKSLALRARHAKRQRRRLAQRGYTERREEKGGIKEGDWGELCI